MISSAYWIDALLTCLGCAESSGGGDARLVVPGLNSEPRGDRYVRAGDVLPLQDGDFSDALVVLRRPVDSRQVVALIEWSCPRCHAVQWVQLGFDRIDDSSCRLVAARAVPLSPELLDQAHYASASMTVWLLARGDTPRP